MESSYWHNGRRVYTRLVVVEAKETDYILPISLWKGNWETP